MPQGNGPTRPLDAPDRQLRLEPLVIDERDRVVLTAAEVAARRDADRREVTEQIARIADRLRASGRGVG